MGETNAPPTATATADTSTVDLGTTVTLDGSESSDPDGDDLTYRWMLEAPSNSSASLSNTSAERPTFTPDVAGDYTATLEVSDGDTTDTDTTTVTAQSASNTSAPSRPIVFVRNGDLHIAKTDGSVEEITGGSSTVFSPSWSPDGTQIAFQRENEIFVVESDGSNPQNITSNLDATFRQPAWSPDGDRIAVRIVSGASGEGIYTIKPDGSDLQAVITGFVSNPAWSPTGDRISFQDGNDGIQTVKTDGSDRKEISSEGLSSTWSPDGSTIAFGTRDLTVEKRASDGSGDIEFIADGLRPAWRSYSRIVFTADERDDDFDREDDNIYTINPDGTEEKQITEGDSEDVDPNWKPVQ